MHIQPVPIVSYLSFTVATIGNRPIRLEILRNHTPMLYDPMLLGQILLCKTLRPRQLTQPRHDAISSVESTVASGVLSVSFFPMSLFIQSSCWLLLEPPELMRPGTTRGMVA